MGRLIDADALIESIGRNIRSSSVYLLAREEINKAKTVDPVTHARWIGRKYPDGSSRFLCSHCGFEDESPYEYRFDFCPKCGARMDDKSMIKGKWRLLNGKWTCSECGNKTDWPLKICNVCASEMEIEL